MTCHHNGHKPAHSPYGQNPRPLAVATPLPPSLRWHHHCSIVLPIFFCLTVIPCDTLLVDNNLPGANCQKPSFSKPRGSTIMAGFFVLFFCFSPVFIPFTIFAPSCPALSYIVVTLIRGHIAHAGSRFVFHPSPLRHRCLAFYYRERNLALNFFRLVDARRYCANPRYNKRQDLADTAVPYVDASSRKPASKFVRGCARHHNLLLVMDILSKVSIYRIFDISCRKFWYIEISIFRY